jgi:hypothetical protein
MLNICNLTHIIGCSYTFFFFICVAQSERLSEFYEVCKTIHVGRGEKFLKIEQVR